MNRFLLLVVVVVLALPGSVPAAIVYSGAQNVTLELERDDPKPQEAVISIAGSPDEWDDFRVVLGFDSMMMDMMGMPRLTIRAPMGMTDGMMWMGGILGLVDMSSQVPYALNLAAGDEIGPRTQFEFVPWASLYDMGVGQFDEDGGYIGLMMPGSAYYGWLRMSDQSDTGKGKGSLRFTFDAWAYAYPPGTPIGAGRYEVEYIAEYKGDFCIKFEDAMCEAAEDIWVDACLGEGGVVETDTFVVTLDDDVTSVDVTIKAGGGKNSEVYGTVGVGDGSTPVATFSVEVTNLGSNIYQITVTSDDAGRTPALSYVMFCFGATVTDPEEGSYPVLRASE